jgi:hypothetical protein
MNIMGQLDGLDDHAATAPVSLLQPPFLISPFADVAVFYFFFFNFSLYFFIVVVWWGLF